MCFGKNVSVQFSEEQLEPLEVNCVSKRFFPSVALMSDCGPVKILNASNGFPFCRKSFKVQYLFTSVTRSHIEKTLLMVLNNGKALHFIWPFLKSEPNECFVNYPLLLKIYLHCLITECKFDALNYYLRKKNLWFDMNSDCWIHVVCLCLKFQSQLFMSSFF